jgi:hypothetical protein
MTEGGAFRREQELFDPVRSWLEAQRLLVRQEFETPFGVCDLVGCRLNHERVLDRLALGQRLPLGPPFRIHVWRQIPDRSTHRSTSLNQLTAALGKLTTEQEILDHLAKLELRRYVRKTRNNNYQRIDCWVPLQESLIAVELKLSRVQEAIRQARSYLSFADRAYVGLPRSLAHRCANADRRRRFEAAGVGLLAIGNSEIEVVIEAPEREGLPKDDVAHTYAVERFFSHWLRGSSS